MRSKLPSGKLVFPLGMGGAEQKTDEKSLLPGQLQELANARFPRTGVIAKRPGMVPAASDTVDGSVTLQRLLGVGDRLLAVGKTPMGARGWYVRPSPSEAEANPASVAMKQINGTPPVARAWVDRIGLAALSSIELKQTDVAVGTSQTMFVASDSNGGYALRVIIDNKTKEILFYDAIQVAAFGVVREVRVLAVPSTNTFVVAVAADDALGGATTPLTLYLTTTAGTLQSRAMTQGANMPWDWAIFGTTVFVARVNSTLSNLVPSTFAATASSLAAESAGSAINLTAIPGRIAVAVPYASTEDALILVSETTNGLRGLTVNTSTRAQVQALWVISATVTAQNHIVAAKRASGTFDAWVELFDATDYSVSVRLHENVAIAGANAGTALQQMYLASKPVVTSASVTPWVVLAHLSKAGSSNGLQPARFLYEGTRVIGRLLRGNTTQPITKRFSTCKAVSQIAAMPTNTDFNQVTEYVCSDVMLSDIAAYKHRARTTMSLAAMRFDVHPSSGYTAIPDEDAVLIQGGFLALYDGDRVTENGFLLYPEIVSVTARNSTGTLPNNGSFGIVAVFFHVDARGRVHRSPPSEVYTATTGATDDTLDVVVRGLVPSQRASYGIEIYRTEDDGGEFYLSNVQEWLAPGDSTKTITLTDADATLITSTPLGQQAGILDNEQPSCPIAISTTGRRVQVVAGDDPYAVIPSKERRFGEGVSFLGGLGGGGATRRVTQDGRIDALATVGERWVAAKGRRIFIAGGEGPDDSDTSNSLTEFEAHPFKGIGVVEPRSLIETSLGLVFKSAEGFQLLDPGGGITYLGSGAHDYKDFPVRSAVFHADAGEVHFLLLDGPKLVLHLHKTKQGLDYRWSIDELDDRAEAYGDIAVVGSKLYAAGEERADGNPYSLFVEDPSSYGDQGAGYPVALRFVTGWIPLTGEKQQRGRLYAARFLGNVKSIHTARVRAAFDYVDTWIDDKTITSERATTGGTAYKWEYRPSKQKIDAIKLEFVEELTSAGQGLELNEIVFDVAGLSVAKSRRSKRAA